MWAKRDYLELAFYPTSTHLDGEVFRHLRFFRKDRIPLEERRSPGSAYPEYRLAHAFQLRQLEIMLFEVQAALQRQLQYYVTLDKKDVPGPSSEPYMAWSRNQEAVLNHAFFARRKFLYHIAVISFYIAIITHGSQDPHRWYSVLLKQGISASVADKFSSTMLADFSGKIPRAGVFIQPDQATAQWAHYVRILISANVPVYIAWGPLNSSPAILNCFQHLYPSQLTLDALDSSQDLYLLKSNPPIPLTGDLATWNTNDFTFEQADQPVSPSGNQSWVSPYFWKGRRLLPGEKPPLLPKFSASDTPGSFFSRRAAACDHYIANVESANQKADRLVREKNALRHVISRKGHDELYEWDFDDDAMRWIRILVSQEDRETIGEMCSPGSSRYNSVAGEWDVADFLEDGSEPSTLEEYNMIVGEGEDEYDSTPSHHRPPIPFFRKEDFQLAPPPPSYKRPKADNSQTTIPSSSAMEPVLSEQSMASSSNPEATDDATTLEPWHQPLHWTNSDDEQEVPNFLSFLEVLMGFHAFRWGSSDITALNLKRVPLPDACRAVGFYLADIDKQSLEEESQKASFVAWVSAMLDKTTSPPPDWCWFHSDSQHHLKQILKADNYPLRLSVLRNKADPRAWWCLHERPQHRCPWFIVLDNSMVALAAIQSMRSWDDLVRWMVASGM